jgi:hypothetical protein
MKPCSCTSSCRGQDGLADGFLCVVDNPGIHERLMQLPVGMSCSDCAHAKRCFALGYSTPERTTCDFYPSHFGQGARSSGDPPRPH